LGGGNPRTDQRWIFSAAAAPASATKKLSQPGILSGLPPWIPLAQIAMAPDIRSHQSHVVRSTLSKISIGGPTPNVKLLGEIISAFSPRKTHPSQEENGPGGIRTRICYLDRVLCSRYTTGPEASLWKPASHGKGAPHNFTLSVPNWELLGALPTARLQHLRIIQAGQRQSLHRANQIFADFK
jgi:hypothetical protein